MNFHSGPPDVELSLFDDIAVAGIPLPARPVSLICPQKPEKTSPGRFSPRLDSPRATPILSAGQAKPLFPMLQVSLAGLMDLLGRL